MGLEQTDQQMITGHLHFEEKMQAPILKPKNAPTEPKAARMGYQYDSDGEIVLVADFGDGPVEVVAVSNPLGDGEIHWYD